MSRLVLRGVPMVQRNQETPQQVSSKSSSRKTIPHGLTSVYGRYGFVQVFTRISETSIIRTDGRKLNAWEIPVARWVSIISLPTEAGLLWFVVDDGLISYDGKVWSSLYSPSERINERYAQFPTRYPNPRDEWRGRMSEAAKSSSMPTH